MTSEQLVERLPLTFTDTPDYAEVRDAQGTLIALTTDPAFFTRLQEALAAAETRKKALEEAAQVAERRHEVWNAGDGFQDGDGLPAVSCDVTACENIAAAIRSLSAEEAKQHD